MSPCKSRPWVAIDNGVYLRFEVGSRRPKFYASKLLQATGYRTVDELSSVLREFGMTPSKYQLIKADI